MFLSDDYVCVGIITGAHGIKGFFKVKYYTEDAESLNSYGTLTNKDGEEIKLNFKGVLKNLAICQINNITNRTDAEKLRGDKLYIKKSKLPKLINGEVYHIDLIGLSAFNESNEFLGTIYRILNYGAGDIIELNRPGEESLLLPFGPGLSKEINLDKKIIILTPPQEWLTINTKETLKNGEY